MRQLVRHLYLGKQNMILKDGDGKENGFKGIVHQFFSRCSNLIFWIVMGCGIAGEGSINGQNSTFLGFHFVPRDLDSRRHMGPRLAAQGTLTRSAGDLDSRRHRFELKGSFTIFLFLVRSHILNSNRVWYS